jgi:hypothetical protein
MVGFGVKPALSYAAPRMRRVMREVMRGEQALTLVISPVDTTQLQGIRQARLWQT